MSKKKNNAFTLFKNKAKDQKNNTKAIVPTFTVIEPDKAKTEPKPSVMEQMSKMLFSDFLRDTLKLDESVETNDVTITAYCEEHDNEENICCYSVVPASNKNVEVSIEPTKIEVFLTSGNTKREVTFDDEQLCFLADNIINYLKRYVVDVVV